jgi:hypothetical protein
MEIGEAESLETWLVILTAGYVLLTAVIAIFTYQMVRLNRLLVWFTGSMESYAGQMLRLEARRQEIKVVWWDPSDEDWPRTGPHGTDASIETVRFGMRPSDRRDKPRIWEHALSLKRP